MVFRLSKSPILGRYQTKVLLEYSSPFSTHCQLILVGILPGQLKMVSSQVLWFDPYASQYNFSLCLAQSGHM